MENKISTEMFDAFSEYNSAMIKHHEEIEASIREIINPLGDQAKKDFSALIEDCNVTGKIEFVESPEGDQQTEDANETFIDVYVDQYTGPLGDDYSGYIYGKLKDGRWIKIPYEC